MKLFLGLDYGDKFFGLAKFRESMDIFPYPWKEGLIKTNFKKKLNTIIEEESIDFLVIGIPYSLNGESNQQSEKYLQIFRQEEFSIPIFYQEESLSSKEAEINQKRKDYQKFSNHSIAAMIILRDFLISKKISLVYP